MNEKIFNDLSQINCNDKTESRNGFTYLSWAWAWQMFKKECPSATYEIKMFDGKPYIYDEKLGYMVFTTVTVDGETHEMWLPVMDSANHAMKDQSYEVVTKYNKFTVPAATMFDVNKTIMRCLVKNLAIFGLGLYLYAGTDLPEATPVVCEDCGKEITAYGKMSAQEMADYTKQKYGKSLCADCATKKAKADAKPKPSDPQTPVENG